MLDVLKHSLSLEHSGAPRREFLTASLASSLIGASSTLSVAADAGHPIRSEVMTFDDDQAEFRAHFRFERDLVERSETVTWYHFLVFTVAEGQRPAPIVRFEGMEYSYYQRVKPLTYRIHAHNLSFARDITTGEFTNTTLNPVTGETVTVPPTVLTEDPGVINSPAGYRTLDSKDPNPVRTYSFYRIEGDLVRREHVRAAPAGWPMPFIESSTSWVDRKVFDDASVTSLPMHTSGFYVAPWPRWMKMGDHKGHMIGAWTGRKLNSIAELPAAYRAKAQSEYPQLLTARWAELERPLPFSL